MRRSRTLEVGDGQYAIALRAAAHEAEPREQLLRAAGELAIEQVVRVLETHECRQRLPATRRAFEDRVVALSSNRGGAVPQFGVIAMEGSIQQIGPLAAGAHSSSSGLSVTG